MTIERTSEDVKRFRNNMKEIAEAQADLEQLYTKRSVLLHLAEELEQISGSVTWKDVAAYIRKKAAKQ